MVDAASEACATQTTPASHPTRRDVSAETCLPSSISDRSSSAVLPGGPPHPPTSSARRLPATLRSPGVSPRSSITHASDGRSAMAYPDFNAETLRKVLGALPDVVIVVSQDRRVLFMSRPDGVHRPEDLEGRDAVEILAPDSRGAGEAALERAFASGEVVRLDPIEVPGPEGETQWYQATVTPIVEEGRTSLVVISSTNVTERVLAEQERALLNWCRCAHGVGRSVRRMRTGCPWRPISRGSPGAPSRTECVRIASTTCRRARRTAPELLDEERSRAPQPPRGPRADPSRVRGRGNERRR